MKKKELISAVAEKTTLTKKATGEVIEAAIEVVTEALKNDDKVAIVGFGVLETVDVAARTGRNPQTGEDLEIPAHKRIKFRASEGLKAYIEG